MSDDLAHELRVIARLMETKAPITFKEQDAAQLRKSRRRNRAFVCCPSAHR
jgi:hypothetical protein